MKQKNNKWQQRQSETLNGKDRLEDRSSSSGCTENLYAHHTARRSMFNVLDARFLVAVLALFCFNLPGSLAEVSFLFEYVSFIV